MTRWHCMDCEPRPRSIVGVDYTTGLCRWHATKRAAELVWRDIWHYELPLLWRCLTGRGWLVLGSCIGAGAVIALVARGLAS